MNPTVLIVIIIVVLVIAFAIYAAINKGPGNDALSADIKSKMARIPSSLKTTNPYEMKSILIEYDKLFDYFLKKKGFKGESMGERLKSARGYFDRETYNRIWIAHKMRNVLVHEVGANFDLQTVRNEIYNLQSALSKGIKA